MSRAQLINIETGEVQELLRKNTIGRADDNDVVMPERWVSRHHCVIRHKLFGGWELEQIERVARGAAAVTHTTVQREGRVIYVRAPLKWKLATGDALAFGKSPGDETLVFTHEFRIVD